MTETRAWQSLPGQDRPETLLTRKAVADWLSLSPKTLANWSSMGLGPQHVKFPCGSLRYERAAVQAWIESHRQVA